MDIWHVSNRANIYDSSISFTKEIRLWRTAPGIFRVIEQGAYTTLLTNPQYILIFNQYAPVFENIPEQAELTSALISDPVTGQENNDYIELHLFHELDPVTIHTTDSQGLKAWVCQGELFISTELKIILEEKSAGQLSFTKGFSQFGGAL